MIYILLTVCVNTLIFVLFKLFSRYQIDTFQAITFNYLVAFTAALVFSDTPFTLHTVLGAPWFWGAFLLGFMFILGFYLIALTTQRLGMSVVAISSKMSMAIPVLFGIFVYGESTALPKIAGIILALTAVYLASYTQTRLSHKIDVLLPLLLFISSGILDTTLKYMQTYYIHESHTSLFLSIVFLMAGTMGSLILLFGILRDGISLKVKNIYAGFILGCVNYFSLYFLLKALQSKGLESATVFTLNNVSIVMLSTLLGVLLFHEKLLRINIVGLVLAVASIMIISLA